MLRSAMGTIDQAEQNVAAKAGLNKSILDYGCFEFIAERLVLVTLWNSSQICRNCGHVDKKERPLVKLSACIAF